jgi:MoxR-like ATPase
MRHILEAVIAQMTELVLGKERQVRLALACFLARGHLLIEDLPGMGKTTLAQGLARTLGLSFKRIQFTSDLLPADIIGVSIFDSEARAFRFHAGPVFAQLVLADEINRATPKAQSALLEAMEEHQVTADGETMPLPAPFFVVATQNPHHHVGTFPLPESQLDRFLMRLTMGYPDRRAEHALLKGRDPRERLKEMPARLDGERLAKLQQTVETVHVSEPLVQYVQDLLHVTRDDSRFAHGLSPRAGLGLLRAARAWALLEGRDMVLPDDVQAVAVPVFAHRLQAVGVSTVNGELLATELLRAVPIP